jgi:hypothetical protein
MKSQDIVILLKLVSLERREQFGEERSFQDAILDLDPYSVRGLAASVGISKTEVNASINRSIAIGMAMRDRNTKHPKPNHQALLEFIIHGLKYVFPAKPGEIARGIPTGFAAPALKGELLSGGEFIYVWPYARGEESGQSVEPLFKSVPEAVGKDQLLYEYLALVDAIRLGNPRESKFAANRLSERLHTE